MKRFPFFVSCVGLLVCPLGASSESMSAAAVVSAGPHGYDWLLGSWSCVNKNPSPLAGPSTSSYTAARSDANGAIFIRTTGKNYDAAAYLSYEPKTRTWSLPAAFSDGSYEIESSNGTGAKVVFTGSYFSGGAVTKVRDIYTLLSANKQTDVGQAQSGRGWKTTYAITCTKS